MNIFGFKVKWPLTKKGIIKKMLKEKGRISTLKFLKKEWGWHQSVAARYTWNLIQEGCMDLDLYQLYNISGPLALRRSLRVSYGFNPNMVKSYMVKIKKLAEKRFKSEKTLR